MEFLNNNSLSREEAIEAAYEFMIDKLKENDLYEVYENALNDRFKDKKSKLSLGLHYLERLGK
jgi:hypothetical protein